MDELNLTEEEVRHVVAACRFIRVGATPPGYLKEFLARRLEEASGAALAARVRQFRDGQMEALWDRVRERQGGK